MVDRPAWSRREFLRAAGLSPALAPFLTNLSAAAAAPPRPPADRLIIVFSPNGIVPDRFWPEPTAEGEALRLTPILEPLEPFVDRTLVLKGLDDKLKGDGDGHMRGIGCLLTGVELLPGNIQGGSHTPAGWSSGASVDQKIKQSLQASDATRTRFGSLEFGVLVPDRADTWTRLVYAGANRPVAPIDDPYQMFAKLYGDHGRRDALRSVLDDIGEDFDRLTGLVGDEDRRLLEEHAELVRSMEKRLAGESTRQPIDHAVPEIEPNVRDANDNMPRISRMQIEMLVASMAADFARVATLQYTNSVGQARMRWLGVEEGQHELSHRPDSDTEAQDKLTRINRWYCEEIAHLARRLAETPEPTGEGSLLDHTLIVWTNELGKGNSHTLNDIPFVLIGGGLGVRGGRSLELDSQPHNRLLLTLAQGFGLEIPSFGDPNLCGSGPLAVLS